MRVLNYLLVLIIFTVNVYAITVETASFKDFMYGKTEKTSYDNWISHVVETDEDKERYQFAPWNVQREGFGKFERPNEVSQLKWKEIVDLFINGEYELAQEAIDTYEYPYDVVEFHDTDTDRTYYMLRERIDLSYFDRNGATNNPGIYQRGSFNYGWGLFVVNPTSEIPINVNVVHPLDDFIAVPVAHKAFTTWDARYFMVTGASRNLSYADPSREENHPFNTFYKAACDEIRETFGRRELSTQIHSFDFTHIGYNSLQISAGGRVQTSPGLPIRDVSGNFNDLINHTPFEVIPANTFGFHDNVTVLDYYSVCFSEGDMLYDDGDMLHPISDKINLPGYSENIQVKYTLKDWNKHDLYSPFFHIEMEEFPSVLRRDTNTYKWFYGYDLSTEKWDADNLYTKALELYTPWVLAFDKMIPHLLNPDDGVPPTAPSKIDLVGASYENIVLSWERSYSADFLTYEIAYSTEPIDTLTTDYNVVDRNQVETLAGQAVVVGKVTGLQPMTGYYFRIRAKDRNGNYSPFSDEVYLTTGSATIASLSSLGRDSLAELKWTASYQKNNKGFNVLRRVKGTDSFIKVASWETEEALKGSANSNVEYTFNDRTAQNGNVYEYKISSVDDDFNEYVHYDVTTVSVQPIMALLFQNESGYVKDTVEFGVNHFATDLFDDDYDLVKGNRDLNNYFYAYSHKPDWLRDKQLLKRDIYSYHDPEVELKTWLIRASTDQINQNLTVSLIGSISRGDSKLFLLDNATGEYLDLFEEQFVYRASSAQERTFTIVWGTQLPEIKITQMTNRYLETGETIEFDWSIRNMHLIKDVEIYLDNGEHQIALKDNMNPIEGTFKWTATEFEKPYTNVSFVVRANLLNGGYFEERSDFKFGVITKEMEISNSAGWHLATNVFMSPVFQAADVFGEEAKLYSFNPVNKTYMPLNMFGFGMGCLVHMPDEYSTELFGELRKTTYEMSLKKGWNLLPNVFCNDLKVKDIIFQHNNQKFNYIEVILSDVIAYPIYGLEDNRYVPIETIGAAECAWIYSNVENLVIRQEPFMHYDITMNRLDKWQLKVEAEIDEFNIDNVTLGHAEGTDESFHFFYDLPKPPKKPDTKLDFYLDSYTDKEPYHRLQSFYKEDLPVGEQCERAWSFTLELDDLDNPVTFRTDGSELPAGYKVVMEISDLYVVLSEENNYVYQPKSKLIQGLLKITNLDVTSVEKIPFATTLHSNYPNPFYPNSSVSRNIGTTIPYSIKNRGNVLLEIYNIKGQKVKTLVNEVVDSGSHSVVWDGKDGRERGVSAGIYFYKLSTGSSEAQIKKMMLLK
ncbi:MAG: FlgD immunoglobulin-like domain containing protein [Candidatus Cloacimonas sp.]|nr:T9SS type A sorting domain-containing protein [Candidatus Cloacimonadota bacterium]